MYLAAIAVIILLLKVLEIGPVAHWGWVWVLTPFALLFLWWEFGTTWLGMDKKEAAKKMKRAEEEAAEAKKRARGF